jgi:hypothetical protein
LPPGRSFFGPPLEKCVPGILNYMMIIDARTLDLKQLLLRMRDVLSDSVGREVSVEVLLSTADETKRLRAFVSMSGCLTTVEKKEDYYIVHITGSVCCA